MIKLKSGDIYLVRELFNVEIKQKKQQIFTIVNNLKVGDIFVLSKRPLSVAKVLETFEGSSYLLSVSSTQPGPLVPVWYSNSILRGRRTGKKKDWYRAIRQYNKSMV